MLCLSAGNWSSMHAELYGRMMRTEFRAFAYELLCESLHGLRIDLGSNRYCCQCICTTHAISLLLGDTISICVTEHCVRFPPNTKAHVPPSIVQVCYQTAAMWHQTIVSCSMRNLQILEQPSATSSSPLLASLVILAFLLKGGCCFALL